MYFLSAVSNLTFALAPTSHPWSSPRDMTTDARMRRSCFTFASNMAVNGVVCSSKMKVQNGKHVIKEVSGKQYGLSEHIKSAQLLVRITL